MSALTCGEEERAQVLSQKNITRGQKMLCLQSAVDKRTGKKTFSQSRIRFFFVRIFGGKVDQDKR